ncbi:MULTISPECIES: hypothetical protein [unclassified Pseudomonas]|uniref:hypothetical protein n=1 Tax=unclassified Pseudomonas TaxID=196821 RepID=UPI00190C87AE|nr:MULTISPECIES: hypothetical protein [unclassified Pseudomonas]MBK3468734.1 hypothetical protein [Pseudomonas sp. MF6776]
MTITAISRVTVALGYDIATNQPVIRHWIDREEVIDTDGAHLFVMVGKKRGAISIRYKLHPLEKEDERALQGGPYSDFNRSFTTSAASTKSMQFPPAAKFKTSAGFPAESLFWQACLPKKDSSENRVAALPGTGQGAQPGAVFTSSHVRVVLMMRFNAGVLQ